jgi:hypothetical protein
VKAFLKVLCRKGSWVLEDSNVKTQNEKTKEECNGESDVDTY